MIEVERDIRNEKSANAFFWVLFLSGRELKYKPRTFTLSKCLRVPQSKPEEEVKGDKAARGDTIVEDTVQNFIFTFGCKPGANMPENTSFTKDIIQLLMKNFDLIKGVVVLPDIFAKIVSSDAMFEISSSSLSQKLHVERQDDTFGFKFFYYIKDSAYDKNKELIGVRREFDKLADLLGVD